MAEAAQSMEERMLALERERREEREQRDQMIQQLEQDRREMQRNHEMQLEQFQLRNPSIGNHNARVMTEVVENRDAANREQQEQYQRQLEELEAQHRQDMYQLEQRLNQERQKVVEPRQKGLVETVWRGVTTPVAYVARGVDGVLYGIGCGAYYVGAGINWVCDRVTQ